MKLGCDNVGRWWTAVAVCALVACGGDDSGADAMAKEVGGACLFTPGSYVVSYHIIDASEVCGDIEATPNEYLTVLNDGTLVGTGAEAADTCVDGPAVVDGCYLAFNRACEFTVDGGHVTTTGGFEYDYADGTGTSTLSIRLYYGTNTLPTTCNVSQEATINRR
jgi:hypothetical protein